ncbi:MAG TPA: hypothetical protein VK787_00835 [Puia sp.]|jgi:hypothetical protein|nr:hypothetical protein [Puia sp.]
MEVHHHPNVEKKNFKEYFLEFLMIFLAVTLGFFAEQMRENVAEHNREKEYLRSMLEDLKTDTANINAFYTRSDIVIDQIDSLMHLIKSPDRNNYGQRTYYFARVITTGLGRFVLRDRTYEEMKSSGSLRLVNDEVLSDSISKYYASQTDFKEQAELQLSKMAAYTDHTATLFDGSVFQQMLQRFPYKVIPPQGNPQLLTKDAAAIDQYIGTLHYYSAIIIINSSRAKTKIGAATDLIRMLQEKYNLQ